MADTDIDKEGVAIVSEPKVVIADNESSTGNELGTNGKSEDNNEEAPHEHCSPTPDVVPSEPEEDKDKESSELERVSPVPAVESTVETVESASENNELNTNGEGVDVETKGKDAQMQTTETYSRPAPQPTKRRPDKDLNHENWDDEDEPEEKGEFKKASDAQLKGRKILTAKRKQKPTQPTNNPFGSLSLGSVAGSVAASFNFNSSENVPAPALPAFDFSSIEPSSNLAGSTSQNETNEGDAKN